MRHAAYVVGALGLVMAAPLDACATTWRFGSNSNGLTGVGSATLASPEGDLQITAGPLGAVFYEATFQGMGVDSRLLPGVAGDESDKFDVLLGDAPPAGQSESVTLRFTKPGRITGIDFDGVKDEGLEYFVLTSGSGLRVNFFDSAANTTVAGAVDAALTAGDVVGQVVYLLEAGAIDDEALGLALPFSAGEALTLTYAELGQMYGPTEPGNGARFQGVTVTFVPEPSSLLTLGLVAAGAASRDRPATAFRRPKAAPRGRV